MQTISDAELQQITIQVAQHLLHHNWLLSSAESCTGGWLSKCCTDIAGSSSWFDRGFVTYSNQSKQDLLNVSLLTLEQYGAVSEQTVTEMAQGALNNSQANMSVAITGIAGPGGGSNEKPVGTVWFAWATNTTIKTECKYFTGDRNSIRQQAVVFALQGIIKNARA